MAIPASIDNLEAEIDRLRAQIASNSNKKPSLKEMEANSHKMAEWMRKTFDLDNVKSEKIEGLFASLVSSKTNSAELVRAVRNGEL